VGIPNEFFIFQLSIKKSAWKQIAQNKRAKPKMHQKKSPRNQKVSSNSGISIHMFAKSFSVLDLSQPLFEGMPMHPADPPFLFKIDKTHEQTKKFFEHGFAYSIELVTTSMHSGTHLDALCHMSKNGLLHGGRKAESLLDRRGNGKYRRLGIEEFKPRLFRSCLLDVALANGFEELPESYSISSKDIHRTAKMENISIENQDAIFLRTGYGKLYLDNPDKYLGSHPGLGKDGASALASLNPSIVGTDNLSFDSMPTKSYDAHVQILVKSGIYILKNLNLEDLAKERIYEFLLVVAPLNIPGATGSLVRPLAIVPK
jgi:kynurenine formamidase